MADKKKVYSIVINGLKESVDMVKSLNEQLKELDAAINKVKDRTVKIKGEVEITNPTETKTVVSGGSSGGSSAEKEKLSDKELAIQKQITAEKKAQAQYDAMQTEEYQKSYAAMSQTKDAIKQSKQELDAMASGAATLTENGLEYSNTMKGMKAELKALKAERDQLDLAKPEEVARFKEIQDRALELETLLKSIESEAGVFSRNVGNYPQLLKQATTEWDNVQKIIGTLSDKLSKMTPGTEGYDKVKSELEQAEKYAQKLDERLGDIKSNLNSINTEGFKLDVGGKEREFNSLKDAVKTLTKELQEMTLAGKENTEEFEVTIEALGKVKTAISQTSGEIQSYVGGAKGLADTIEIMRGLTGIMSIGTGLASLFGDTNKEVEETMRKFAGLTLIMQGIEVEYKAIQDGTSIWGDKLSKTWTWLDKIGKWTGMNWIIGQLDKASKATDKWYQKIKTGVEWQKRAQQETKVSDTYNEAMSQTISFRADDASLKKIQQDVINALSDLETFKVSFQFANKEDALKYLEDIRGQIMETINDLEDMKINLEVNDASEEEIAHIDNLIDSTKEKLTALDNTELYINTGDTEEIFKQIDKTIDELTEKIDMMEAAGEDTSGLDAMRKSLEQFRAQAATATTATTGFSSKLIAAGTVGKVAAAGINFATLAVKGLTVAIKALGKATIILAVIQAAMEVLQPIIEAISSAVGSLMSLIGSLFSGKGFGSMELEDRLEALDRRIALSTEKMNKYLSTLDKAQKMGFITELEKEGLAFKEIEKNIKAAGDELARFLKTQDEFKIDDLANNLNNSNIWGDAADIQNIDDFKAHYEALVKAVEAGTDVIKAGWTRGSEGWLTAGDAVEQLGDDTKAVLGDMAKNIIATMNNSEAKIEDFRKITDNELYKSALANMHTLFKEEEWAKSLDRLYKVFDERVNMMEGRAEDLAVAISKANKELADQTELSNINAIADATERQNKLDEYNKKKRQEEINQSVADEQHKQAALAALDAEYEQKRKDRVKARLASMKSAGDDEYNILKQIRDNLLNLQAEGLDKEIQKLKNAMDDELHAAEKATKHRGELILSIQKKYQKLIEDKRAEWYKNLRKQQEQWNKEWAKMMQESAQELADIQNTASLNSINRNLDQNENVNIKKTANISYDTNVDTSSMSFADNDKNLQLQKEYYDKLLKQQTEYIAEKTKLQLEESQENERILKETAEREYNQRLSQNKEWYDTQIEQQNEAVKKGLVTEEEYNENLLAITNSYQNANADAYETYQTKLNEATKNGEQERNTIITQGRQEQQRINDEANQKALAAIQEYYNEIADIAEREQRQNMNRHTGLFNYSKEKERLEKVKAGYEKTMADLETEYEKLKAQLNDNEIDFSQFQEGKKQIEDLKKQAKKAAQDTSESLSDLFQTWAGSINDFAQQIGQQLQSLYSTFNEIQNLKLEAEQQALDEEQEMLDKEKDMVEKAYEKQADIVQRYKDSINDTEDELKNARGERRLALLDSLAEQREGYLKETETLQKQQKEKEKIAKKEEQLKKKQDNLEKKRKQQQQQAAIVNAIINTALGVTQALASWPPPASYALAAAVGALGAVEISLIASQKYAKGGVIEGPDHAHGGVKIQTNKGMAEVEGKEFITNKTTTTQNLELMEFVNSKKRRLNLDDFIEFYSGKAKYQKAGSSLKFADGGTMPELTDYNEIVQQQPLEVNVVVDSKVSVVDIQNALDRLTATKVLAGL